MNKQELYTWQEEGTACLNFDPQRIWQPIHHLKTVGILKEGGDPKSPVLCAGCRNGFELKCFEDLGYTDVHGFDWSRKMIAVSMLTTDYDIRCADLMNPTPFDNQTFDIVYCSHTLEHIEDFGKGFNNLYYLTKQGGYTIIVLPKEPEPPSKYHITRIYTIEQITDIIEHWFSIGNDLDIIHTATLTIPNSTNEEFMVVTQRT